MTTCEISSSSWDLNFCDTVHWAGYLGIRVFLLTGFTYYEIGLKGVNTACCSYSLFLLETTLLVRSSSQYCCESHLNATVSLKLLGPNTHWHHCKDPITWCHLGSPLSSPKDELEHFHMVPSFAAPSGQQERYYLREAGVKLGPYKLSWKGTCVLNLMSLSFTSNWVNQQLRLSYPIASRVRIKFAKSNL